MEIWTRGGKPVQAHPCSGSGALGLNRPSFKSTVRDVKSPPSVGHLSSFQRKGQCLKVFNNCSSRFLWPGLSNSNSVFLHRLVNSCFLVRTSCKSFFPQNKGEQFILNYLHHHLGRYSCGSPLKFLLCSAWSTVRMNESIICFMSGANGSKEGFWPLGRLKWPSWLLFAHRSLSSVMLTFRKAAIRRRWERSALCRSS